MKEKPSHMTVEEGFNLTDTHQGYPPPYYVDDDEHTAILLPGANNINKRLVEQQQRVGCLIVLAGDQAGKVLELKEAESRLGRATDTELPLLGHGISRHHALIRRSADPLEGYAYSIEDLGSKNGTFLNGKSVPKAAPLKDGDLITLGGAFLLKFKRIEKSYLKARTHTQVAQIQGGIIQTSALGEIVFINGLALELLGIDPKEKPAEAYLAALRAQLIKGPDDFMGKQDIEVWQTQVGSSIYRCHSTPLYAPSEGDMPPKLTGIVNFFLDASLDSMLEREMNIVSQQLLVASQRANAARQAAETANQAKSEFLARMSHELRTPLNAIIGYAELLIEEVHESPPEIWALDLEKIRGAGRHLLDLIDEVLDISRLEAGKIDLHLETFSLTELIQIVSDLTEPLAAKGNNKFVVRVSRDLGEILSDKVKIRQIIFNILSNSCKFTENGEILLVAKKLHHGGQLWYQLSVRDTGIGMTPEQTERIFDAFYQAESSTTRRYDGTGLGLTVCKKFCDLLGGQLHVKSELGEGTTFTVLLPPHFPTPLG